MMDLSPGRGTASGATGESLLVCAVLSQAWTDVQSANADIRRDAEKFWTNPNAVAPWADALDLAVDALTEAVRRLRQAHPAVTGD